MWDAWNLEIILFQGFTSRQFIFVDPNLTINLAKNDSDKYLVSLQFSWLKSFHVSLLMFKLLKILFYLLAHATWLINHLLDTVLQPLACPILSVVTDLLFSFLLGSSPIHALNSNSWRKQRQACSNLILKIRVVNHFNIGQTDASNSKLFHFDIPKHH